MKRQGENTLIKLRWLSRFSILAIMVLLPWLSYSQKLDEQVRVYFTEVRAGKNPAIPKEILQPENARIVLGELTSYQRDTVSVVRSKVYMICHRVGNGTKQSTLRQTAVTRLVLGCKDEDTGNAGLALDYLTTFRKDDFTASSKDGIRSLVRNKTAHFDQLLKLAGFLELTDLKESINPYTQPGNAQPIRWAALISLSRMNDAEAIGEVMRRVRKLPVNDDLVYKIFPDLVYTRNAEAICYMVEVMQRDDKNCMTADAEREEPMPCGYRIMEQLAPVIVGYPVQLDESGDIKAKDYTAALQKVRDWFTKYTDYTILRDRF
jgi:hypothetical protein